MDDTNRRLIAALRNLVGVSCSDSAWWECEGLSRHEGTGKTSAEIHADVLEEARDLLAELVPTESESERYWPACERHNDYYK